MLAVDLPIRGSDEIASRAVSFGRMCTSLVAAFEIRDEAVRVTVCTLFRFTKALRFRRITARACAG